MFFSSTVSNIVTFLLPLLSLFKLGTQVLLTIPVFNHSLTNSCPHSPSLLHPSLKIFEWYSIFLSSIHPDFFPISYLTLSLSTLPFYLLLFHISSRIRLSCTFPQFPSCISVLDFSSPLSRPLSDSYIPRDSNSYLRLPFIFFSSFTFLFQ